jgi:hypothetical protein
MLEGGAAAWAAAGLPMLAEDRLPERDAEGRTIWVTRARPKVDRIACPWLIRRFVDSEAVFLFVAPAEVAGVAERFGAAPFDVEGAYWSHRGSLRSSAAPTRRGPTSLRRRRACSPPRSACRACSPTISSSSTPA